MYQTKFIEKIKTNDFNLVFLENRAVYETMWKNIVEPDGPQMTMWCMRIACWINKASSTHSEYVILLPPPH